MRANFTTLLQRVVSWSTKVVIPTVTNTDTFRIRIGTPRVEEDVHTYSTSTPEFGANLAPVGTAFY